MKFTLILIVVLLGFTVPAFSELTSSEIETSEFKENFDQEVIETAVAFANIRGGIILIGVSDNGDIRGITIGKETLRNWSNRITQATEPRVVNDTGLVSE